MNSSIDLNPTQFSRHERAVEARIDKAKLRNSETPLSDHCSQHLAADFTHATDATNFLLSSLDCPPMFRGFIDAVVGVSGYRAGRNEWFEASDRTIARRADRCTKWVQNQRKELLKWQTLHNFALIDIEDNKYNQREKTPHKYRVNIAHLAAETVLDARDSLNWRNHRFDEAMEDAAKITRDSLPEVPTHVKHKRSYRPDAEKKMEQDLSYALTKIRKAKQGFELTGNRLELNAKMLDIMNQIRSELDWLSRAV